ncbi:MAG TPA: T9SS type A sorting domain-containing protein [Lentimicrobium sp.]|nr:T9SS type A sorting domain-containing protein [Lentimicrobium sp.]
MKIFKLGILLMLYSILLVFPAKSLFSQQLALEWHNKFGYDHWDFVNDMVRLSNGSYVLAGSIQDTSMNGSDHKGQNRAWICMVDSNGVIIWERIFTGADFQTINSITESNNGILIAGVFTDSISIDSLSLKADSYLSGFYALADYSGNINELSKAGQKAIIYNLIVSPRFGTKTFTAGTFKGTLNISGTNFPAKYTNSVFLSEISESNELTDLTLIHSSGDLLIKSIDCNDSVLCLAGSFSDTLFIKDSTFISTGKHDAFICCYDSNSLIKWIKIITGTGEQAINDISLSDDNKCGVAGYFDMNAFIDSTVFQSYGSKDMLIAYFDEKGTLLWGKNFGNLSNDYGYAVKVRGSNIYFSGSFVHEIGLPQSNGNTIALESLSPFGNSFIAKYNFDGELQATYNFPGTSEDYCQSLEIDEGGKITAVGNFYNKLVLQDSVFQTVEINSAGDKDVFMLHFDDICENFKVTAGADTTVCAEGSVWLIVQEEYTSYIWEPGGTVNNDLQVYRPGVYHLSATDQYGCLSTDSLTVSPGMIPEIFAGHDTIIEAGQNIVLNTAIASNAMTLTWSADGNGFFATTNDLNTEYYISNDDISNGSVTLSLDGSNQCGSSTDSLLVIIPMDDDGVLAYPNPFQSSVTIVCEEGLTIQSIIITTQTGFVVLPSQTVNNYFFTYDLSSYPPGSFVFYVTTNNGVVTKVINKI